MLLHVVKNKVGHFFKEYNGRFFTKLQLYFKNKIKEKVGKLVPCPVSLIQLIRTTHSICKVRSSNPKYHKKKLVPTHKNKIHVSNRTRNLTAWPNPIFIREFFKLGSNRGDFTLHLYLNPNKPLKMLISPITFYTFLSSPTPTLQLWIPICNFFRKIH